MNALVRHASEPVNLTIRERPMDDRNKDAPSVGQSSFADRSQTGPSSLGQHKAPKENEKATATATDLKDKVVADVRSATNFAKQEVAGLSDKAKDAADDQKNFLTEKIRGVAQAIEKVAAELEQGDNRDIGRITRTVGSSMRKFSTDIQDRSLSEIAGMAEDFGRKQPLAFLGIAAIAGLAASRFLTASAPHQDRGVNKPPMAEMTSATNMHVGSNRSIAPHPTSNTEGRFNG
ncbi:nutrient deprivation-induced protein [Neorhizobium sp. T786]|uniref:nutrient deprivation-induced protein n=1 Tax=Pseudorhizobium xiangyangii TaxID=2883104 RepID=UPI001CFF551C|nr:nutrient deprivation-induced protein [Neorhizobium xiangyangii]MCB5203787.1 nutrient deprivation-induced protein [Neorhizobium xiangyangii]